MFRLRIRTVLNFLDHLLNMLGDNPSLTPWILLIIMFVLIALATGRAGKMALGNVDTLMRQGEAQRERMEKELHRKDLQLAARDQRIADLEDDQRTTVDYVTNSRREMAQLHDRIFELERINRGLVEDYQATLILLEVEREKNDGQRSP